MTSVAVKNALRSRFDLTFAAAHPEVGVAYDNHNFEPTTDQWVRFAVLFGETRIISIGGTGQRLYRMAGSVKVVVNERISSDGTETILALLDEITAAFRGYTVSSPAINVDTPSPSQGSRDGPWWRRALDIPFRADEYA